jgi:hypothetical protein
MNVRSVAPMLAALLLCAAIPSAASAQGNPYLKGAITLYGDLEYERALEQLKKAASFPGNGIAEDVQINVYSGLTKAELGDMAGAESDFKAALALQGDLKLPVKVAPKIGAVFDKAVADLARQRPARAVAAVTPVIRTPPKTEPPKVQPVTPSVLPTPDDPPVNSLPHVVVTGPRAGTPGADPSKAKRASPLASILLLGAGAALGGGGGYFGSESSKSVEAARAASFQSDAVASLSTAQSKALTANLMYGAAGVAVLVGTITLIVSQTGSSE